MGREKVATAGRAETLSRLGPSLLVRGRARRRQHGLDALGGMQHHGERSGTMVECGGHLCGYRGPLRRARKGATRAVSRRKPRREMYHLGTRWAALYDW